MMRSYRLSFSMIAWLLVSLPLPLWGQSAPPLPGVEPQKPKLKSADFIQGLAPFGGIGNVEELLLSAQFQIKEGTRDGRLSITAEPAPGWHVYSITQQPGGPMASVLTVSPSKQYKILEPFVANVEPLILTTEFFDVPVEEHHEKVVWSAPIRISQGIDPTELTIQATFDGQVCDDAGEVGCIPKNDIPLEAQFAGYYKEGEYRAAGSHVTFRGYVEAKTDGTLQLVIQAETDPPYHIYAYQPTDPEISGANKPTLIVLSEVGLSIIDGPLASAEPTEHETGIAEAPISKYHEGTIQWSYDLKWTSDSASLKKIISGIIGYQSCSETSCDMPQGVRFSVTLGENPTGRLPLAFAEASYEEASKQVAASSNTSDVAFDNSLSTLAYGLMAAFLGGLILNVMPCVLPVIGLKLMSFVQQAGESRWRVFALNLWYSLGMIAVFMVFAGAAVFLKFTYGTTIKWGSQFSDPRFSIPMAAVLFVLGLSLFGIWEIPIPGFVGSGKASDLAAKEGASGAFFKGVLTTILATPCSGPFVIAAVGFAVAAPVWLTFLAFAMMGLGMASPFLLVGIFPAMIRFLPKPGAWMNTFKQWMGFVLMATIVWFFSFIGTKYTVPTLSLLVGLGVACWIIGRTPLTAELNEKLKAWAYAGVVTAVMIWFSFVFLFPKHELPWQPYSRPALEQQLASGNTVLVDFTANW